MAWRLQGPPWLPQRARYRVQRSNPGPRAGGSWLRSTDMALTLHRGADPAIRGTTEPPTQLGAGIRRALVRR
jgi:hypothetical protein